MYLRETRRKNKDGSVVAYLQLAHNERHQQTGSPVARVIHNFGRADNVDRAGLARLVASISRFLEPGTIEGTGGSDVEVIDSHRFGGIYVLDRLWERLGIGTAIRQAAQVRQLDADVTERVVFALVADRCLEPTTRPAALRPATGCAAVLGCPAFHDDGAYAAMDFLVEASAEIASHVFSRTTNLFSLASDLVYVDTSFTYFCSDAVDGFANIDRPGHDVHDEAARRGDESPYGPLGRPSPRPSGEHNSHHPQVVIAMAGTKGGIPIRCWTFPATTSEQVAIRKVKEDLARWQLHRAVWVKGSLELRPVLHPHVDPIRAHVQLHWLALLLTRTVEHATDATWPSVRNELDRMHLVTLAADDGQFNQRSTTTPRQRELLSALEVAEPPRIFDFEPSTAFPSQGLG